MDLPWATSLTSSKVSCCESARYSWGLVANRDCWWITTWRQLSQPPAWVHQLCPCTHYPKTFQTWHKVKLWLSLLLLWAGSVWPDLSGPKSIGICWKKGGKTFKCHIQMLGHPQLLWISKGFSGTWLTAGKLGLPVFMELHWGPEAAVAGMTLLWNSIRCYSLCFWSCHPFSGAAAFVFVPATANLWDSPVFGTRCHHYPSGLPNK